MAALGRKKAFLIVCVGVMVLCLAATQARAATYALNGDVVGEPSQYAVQGGETLYDVARKFGLGIAEVLMANPGVDPWLPDEGEVLILPTMHILPATARKGIVINLSELRLYFYPDAHTIMTYPIGIGKEGWETPVGHTTIASKRKYPTWIPPASIRKENPDLPALVPAGPHNPLGDYALYLGWPAYLIHGTNRPYGIGWRTSHGCIRMYPEHIEELFPLVPIGTRVNVIDTNYKIGWKDNQLWIEVFPTQQQVDDITAYKSPQAMDIPELHALIESLAGEASKVNWYAVDNALASPSGLPVMIAEIED